MCLVSQFAMAAAYRASIDALVVYLVSSVISSNIVVLIGESCWNIYTRSNKVRRKAKVPFGIESFPSFERRHQLSFDSWQFLLLPFCHMSIC